MYHRPQYYLRAQPCRGSKRSRSKVLAPGSVLAMAAKWELLLAASVPAPAVARDGALAHVPVSALHRLSW